MQELLGTTFQYQISKFRFAHLDFKDVDSFKKALKLNKTEVGGYYLSVEKAIPLRGGHQFGRRDGGNRGIRGGWRSGGSWRH